MTNPEQTSRDSAMAKLAANFLPATRELPQSMRASELSNEDDAAFDLSITTQKTTIQRLLKLVSQTTWLDALE